MTIGSDLGSYDRIVTSLGSSYKFHGIRYVAAAQPRTSSAIMSAADDLPADRLRPAR